ncbi:MAG: ABC transporter substrate-binding protein, partial [Porphyromonas endodontalis]
PREEWVKVLINELGISETAALAMELPDFTPATIPTLQELEEMNLWLKSKKLVDESYSTQQLLP